MFAALQSTSVWWGIWIQAANQTCTDQPFLPEVRRSTMIHDYVVHQVTGKFLKWSVVSSFTLRYVPQRTPSDVGGRGVQWSWSSRGQNLPGFQWPTTCRPCHLWNRCLFSAHSQHTSCCVMLEAYEIFLNFFFFFRSAKWNSEWGQCRAGLLLYYGLLQSH